MAITKILHMKEGKSSKPTHLKQTLQYILQPEKTSNGKYVGAGGCMPETAFEDMMSTKRDYGKLEGRQGYHIIISFPETELGADEDTVFNVVNDFAEQYLGRNFEYVYAVHNDKVHTHAHLVWNSVSRTTGLKYRYKKGDWLKDIQPLVNQICKKYGLGELDIKEHDSQKPMMEREPKTWKDIIKKDILACINESVSYTEFKKRLIDRGYELKDQKYLSVRPKGKERYARTHTIHPAFEKNNIIEYFDSLIEQDIEDTRTCSEDISNENDIDWNLIKYDLKDFFVKGKTKSEKYFLPLNDYKKLRTDLDRKAWMYQKEEAQIQRMQEQALYLHNREIKTGKELIEREMYLRELNEKLTSLRVTCYQKRYPYKELLSDLARVKELIVPANAYTRGLREFKDEHEELEAIVKQFKYDGYTLAEVQELYNKYQKPLDLIAAKKKLIADELKIINRIKKPSIEEDKKHVKTKIR